MRLWEIDFYNKIQILRVTATRAYCPTVLYQWKKSFHGNFVMNLFKNLSKKNFSPSD